MGVLQEQQLAFFCHGVKHTSGSGVREAEILKLEERMPFAGTRLSDFPFHFSIIYGVYKSFLKCLNCIIIFPLHFFLCLAYKREE